MAIYIYIIIVLLIFPLTSLKNNKIVFSLSFVLLWIICAFRDYSVGSDTENYKTLFLNSSSDSDVFEKGFNYFLIFIKYLGFGNPRYYFVIVTFLFLSFVYLSIKKNSVNLLLSVSFFVLLGHYLLFFNIERQILAASIMLYALKLLADKNVWGYICINLFVALLIHNSIILMLCIPILFNVEKIRNKFVLFIIISLSFLIPLLIDLNFIVERILLVFTFLSGNFQGYLQNDIGDRSIVVLFIRYFYFIFLLYITPQQQFNNIYVFTTFIGVAIFFIIGNVPMGVRLSDNFFIVQCISFPMIISTCNKKYKIYISSIILLYSFYMFIGRLLVNNGEIIPYKFASF